MERIPKIRVSTESRPWRRKFSRRSSRDSNPRPFNHESGALTTELSPPSPYLQAALRSVCSELYCDYTNVMSPNQSYVRIKSAQSRKPATYCKWIARKEDLEQGLRLHGVTYKINEMSQMVRFHLQNYCYAFTGNSN